MDGNIISGGGGGEEAAKQSLFAGELSSSTWAGLDYLTEILSPRCLILLNTHNPFFSLLLCTSSPQPPTILLHAGIVVASSTRDYSLYLYAHP